MASNRSRIVIIIVSLILMIVFGIWAISAYMQNSEINDNYHYWANRIPNDSVRDIKNYPYSFKDLSVCINAKGSKITKNTFVLFDNLNEAEYTLEAFINETTFPDAKFKDRQITWCGIVRTENGKVWLEVTGVDV
ncbi:MAG: hypothetical protein MUO82_12185 [Candidatus Thermoplasmatota archaeon]|nr:hypothetical protein [Candidatus Thermoplasmatota archaeon]